VNAAEGEAVGLGHFVDVVGGDHRAGAGHVLDPDVRIAGDVFGRPIRPSGNARQRMRSSFGADLTKSSYFPPLHFGAHRTSVFAVKILIKMPSEQYDSFVAKCNTESGEYSTLINGMVVRDAATGEKRFIEILCEKDDAVRLLDTAGRCFPDAVPNLRSEIDRSREL